jgi:hypothetical protein
MECHERLAILSERKSHISSKHQQCGQCKTIQNAEEVAAGTWKGDLSVALVWVGLTGRAAATPVRSTSAPWKQSSPGLTLLTGQGEDRLLQVRFLSSCPEDRKE